MLDMSIYIITIQLDKNMNKEKIIIISLGVVGIIALIIVFTFLNLRRDYIGDDLGRESMQELFIDDNEFKVFEVESESSFTSGHKVVSLYDKNGKIIDELVYGEHPLILESIRDNKLQVLIPITFYEKNDIEYINSWIEKNKKIGEYSIEYHIFNDFATSTDDFKYPR